MARIIAIEADYKRRRLLALLIREYVNAEVKAVDSVASAIGLMREKTPDLVLTPALLSPKESAELIAFVKEIDAPYVQLVTLPALDMLSDAPKDEPGALHRLLPVFGRRRAPLAPQYDRAMVGAQIADAVARAGDARNEYKTMLVERAAAEEVARARARSEAQAIIKVLDAGDLKTADRRDVLRVAHVLGQGGSDDRRTARRRPLGDIPWLSGVKLALSTEAALVNISTSGVLVETGSKLTPGSTTELHLTGTGGGLIVPVRIVRSEIARIDGFGVKYHAAAAFDAAIDLSGPRRPMSAPSTPPEALAQLLSAALSESGSSPEPAHARFARGVRDLVGARDVQVRTMMSTPSAGSETLYFDVPGDDRARTILQVVFQRNHTVTSSEFQLLKAAAWLTAAALEFDRPAVVTTVRVSGAPVALLEEMVA